ncbi:hypothetical protein AVEN_154978-1 [Araneus ventricosus]|uniref:Uncharacterized protein n=1 Tax=Araneus ventricosus TaxID=182803 RepID=A0A4Y2A8V4_ARAVE|nr:hypothetical protein AVEN_154978-1 [Araneus ventricosus]
MQSNKLDNGQRRIIPRIFQKPRWTGITKHNTLQIINISRQQLTNNNGHSTINGAQRITADQLALRTKLQRDSCVSVPMGIYSLPTGHDVTWNSVVRSLYLSS